MYASHPPVARREATLATGLPATALTGLDFHQLDFFEWFHRLISDPPLPRFSQRDGLQIDHQVQFGRLHDRQIAGPGPFDYLIDLRRRNAIEFWDVDATL